MIRTEPDTCKACGGRRAPLRAVIAWGADGTGTVLHADAHILCDLKESMLRIDDVFSHTDAGAIEVWEGHIGTWETHTPDGHEYDSEYVGDFRPPTDAEWDAIRRGAFPWPETEPADVKETT